MIILDKAIDLLSNIAGAIKEAFSFQSKKLDTNNTDRMQKAADAQDEVKAVDKTNKAIADKDESEIQRELAE